MKRIIIAALAALMAGTGSLAAQERVKESSTGKTFPVQMVVTHEGKNYGLTLTGTTVRKKVVFKVYAIAHYAEDPQAGSLDDVIAATLQDGKAKEIVMEFVREVGVDNIQSAYRDGFKENATESEAKAIAPLVEQFLAYFTKDVKENDRFVLQWLPGGVVIAQTQGTTHPAITNPTFARVLWSIWLGEDSIVDREELVERFVK